MRLLELHLYGFGRFQDYRIELLKDPIHIFLGENERGKSTIMAFIRSVLFGFPTKLQNELRYEPRLGGRYGGSLTLETERFGKLTIERISGKATGDVTVYLSDGTIGGDELLKLVLGDLDRNHFTGIYSFSMTDLQNIEGLNSEELNRFLYGVGISGRHSLLEIEKKTEKKLQELYKPSGRKPVINNMIRNVTDLEEKVDEWKRKQSLHEQLVNEKHDLSAKLEKLAEEKTALNKSLRYFEKLETMTPIVNEKKVFEDRLQQLPPYEPFPEDGINRLEKFQDNYHIVKTEIVDIEKKLEKIKSEIEALQVREDVAEIEEVITDVRETRQIYENKKEEKGLLIQQLQFHKQEYENLREKVGINQFESFRFDTNFFALQSLEKLIEEEENLKQQEKLLQSMFKQNERSLEDKEAQVEMFRGQVLDAEKRSSLERQKENQKTEMELQQELSFVNQSLQSIKDQIQLFSKPLNTRRPFYFIGAFICLLLSGILFFMTDWYFSVLLLFIALIFISLTKLEQISGSTKMVSNLNGQNNQLMSRKQEILAKIAAVDNKENSDFEEQLKKDDQLREQLFLKEINLREANESYLLVCTDLDQLETSSSTLKEHIDEWANSYSYPSGLTASHYLRLFQLIETVRKKQLEIKQITEKANSLEKQIENLESTVTQLCVRFQLPYSKNHYLQSIEKLSMFLKQEKEKETCYLRLTDQQAQLLEKLEMFQIKENHYKKEIEKLYHVADTKTEEDFRKKGRAWQESRQIIDRLRDLKSQLIPQVTNEEELILVESDVMKYRDVLVEEIAKLESDITTCWQEEKLIHEQMAQVTIKLEEIEEGSSYSRTLHNFENGKDTLREEMKKWAFYRTVQFIIDEAKTTYEKERQPLVIQEAARLFACLTNNEYVGLFAPIGERKIIVERFDGQRFDPNELSQGTKEQLYFAIRLALANIHSKETSYPLFMDDVFVNFDENRRQQAMTLLKEISKNHQIIFFTCHPFMATEISDSYYTLM